MRIQHNLSAMNSLSQYHGNNSVLSGNLEKLSSGYKINSAADDAAGLAISEKMRSQIAGLEKAQDNANDGISLIQTAEGALKEVNKMLTRLDTLATQSANGTYDKSTDRANIQEETDALLSEIDRISKSTNFNGINLLDGSMSGEGVKQTEVSVKVNGVDFNAMDSTEARSTAYELDTLMQGASVKKGDSQTVKMNFLDEMGNERSASISFEAGGDGVASTKNLAEAINKDSVMAKHFTASVDEDNKLIITSNVKAEAADGKNITRGAASIVDGSIKVTNGDIKLDKQGVHNTITNVQIDKAALQKASITKLYTFGPSSGATRSNINVDSTGASRNVNVIATRSVIAINDIAYNKANRDLAAALRAGKTIYTEDISNFAAKQSSEEVTGQYKASVTYVGGKHVGSTGETTKLKSVMTASGTVVNLSSLSKVSGVNVTASATTVGWGTMKVTTADGSYVNIKSVASFGAIMTGLQNGTTFAASGTSGSIYAIKSDGTIDTSVGNSGKVAEFDTTDSGIKSTSSSLTRVTFSATTVGKEGGDDDIQVKVKIKEGEGLVDGVKLYDAKGNQITDNNGLKDALEKGTALFSQDITKYEAKEGVYYTADGDDGLGRTADKSFDLSSLTDGDRVQINGTNYTYRANSDDVKSSTDFHTGSQLAAMSQAIDAENTSNYEITEGTTLYVASYTMQNGKISEGSITYKKLDSSEKIRQALEEGTTIYATTKSVNPSADGTITGVNGSVTAVAGLDYKAKGDGLGKITVKDEFEAGSALSLQVGDTDKDFQKVSIDIKDMSSTGLGLGGLDLSTQESAQAAIDTIKTAVSAVSTQRGKLGALQNRLSYTLNNLDATTQNITAAESQIRDTDMAKEMTQYSKNNILAQAAQSMLAQANSMPQGVLSLLG